MLVCCMHPIGVLAACVRGGVRQVVCNEGAMVNGLDLSACGTRLFTGDAKGQIRCWDRAVNKQDLAHVEGAR